MTPSETALARRIAEVLDESTDQIEPAVKDRLAAARREALSHYKQPHPVWAWMPAWATGGLARASESRLGGFRYVVPVAVLVVGLIAITYWQQNGGRWNELAEIDAGLLADELPIDAYLDKGFDTWLTGSSR
jgi:hypothetical protein